jgi:4-hydroxy-tetrahydrodipicolinate synthase
VDRESGGRERKLEAARPRQSAGLRGIIPVLPTPFTPDGGLDRDGLERLFDHAVTWGASGLAVLGVASEADALSPAEYEAVVRLAGRRLAGRATLVVGVSGADPRSAARGAAAAGQAGAAAVFAKCPPPSGPGAGEREVVEYFGAIAEAAGVPVMAQSFAAAGSRDGILSLEVLRRVVAAEPRIRYVKEETPPPEGNGKITRVRQALGDAPAIFSGSGGITLPDDLRRGAVGCMPGAVLVRGLLHVFELMAGGKADEADALHAELLPLILFRARWGSVAVTKLLLHEAGILPSPHVRRPGEGPLDAEAQAELRRLARRLRAWL